jgi:hypothetical protein
MEYTRQILPKYNLTDTHDIGEKVVGKKDMGKKDHGGPLQPGKVYSSI